MLANFINPSKTVLLVTDVQEKIFPAMLNAASVLNSICLLIQAFQQMHLPILVTEQNPNGLGTTLPEVRELLKTHYHPWIKTTFSSLDNESFLNHLSALGAIHVVVVGFEAHICILQTAKSLQQIGKEPVVLADATTSRYAFNYQLALNEMRQEKIRVTSLETLLFELLKDSTSPYFKMISSLVKNL